MAITDTVENFQIGRVISRTFGTFARNAALFLLVAALAMLPVLLVNLYMGSPNYMVVGTNRGWGFGVLVLAVQLVCPPLLQATLVQATITDLNGERPDLGQSLSTGVALFLPVVGITLVYFLGLIFGLVLLIVPGLILMTAWAVAIPARVVERTGFWGAFSRSGALTKNHRWKIFGLLLLYGIVAIVTSFLILAVAGVSFAKADTMTGDIPYLVFDWIERVILSLVVAIGFTTAYYELRTVKEGMAPQQLAAAFD
jgi:hypothetical protein